MTTNPTSNDASSRNPADIILLALGLLVGGVKPKTSITDLIAGEDTRSLADVIGEATDKAAQMATEPMQHTKESEAEAPGQGGSLQISTRPAE